MFNKISPALKVALFYLTFSLLWIFTSDSVVASIAQNKENLIFLQTIKGWFFVSATSLLIYFLTKHYLKKQSLLTKQIEIKRQELKTIINSSPIPTIVYNEEGEVLIMNKIWHTLTGYEYKEINSLEKWMKKAFKEEAEENKKRIKDIFKITSRVDNGEFTIWTKNNEQIVWHFNSAPFGTRNGKRTIISSAIDITQLKKQNQMMIQQSKMAALGEMIENIAHQWRQPLSSISALSTGVQLKNEMQDLSSDYIQSSMQTIHDNTKYLSNTIDDFRKFFDKGKIKRHIKIDETLQKAIDLMKSRLINNNIKIVLKSSNTEIESFENELIQVFINLINNSIDELLKITHERIILIETTQNNENLIISCKDNAGGISKENLLKVFEAYFTTKDKNHGTGIGLFMSKEIITKHCSGTIHVSNTSFELENKEYKGANFEISLPLKY